MKTKKENSKKSRKNSDGTDLRRLPQDLTTGITISLFGMYNVHCTCTLIQPENQVLSWANTQMSSLPSLSCY